MPGVERDLTQGVGHMKVGLDTTVLSTRRGQEQRRNEAQNAWGRS